MNLGAEGAKDLQADAPEAAEDEEERWEKIPEERRLAAEKRTAGLSVEEIAEDLNRDHSTVWRWLNRDPDTMAYLRWLSEERRARFGSLTMETTEMSLKAVLAAVAMGDADTAIKFLTLAMRDEIARERLWFGQQG